MVISLNNVYQSLPTTADVLGTTAQYATLGVTSVAIGYALSHGAAFFALYTVFSQVLGTQLATAAAYGSVASVGTAASKAGYDFSVAVGKAVTGEMRKARELAGSTINTGKFADDTDDFIAVEAIHPVQPAPVRYI